MIDKTIIEKNKKRLLAEKKRLEDLLSRVAKKDASTRGFQPIYEEIGSQEDENASEVTMFEQRLAEERDLEERLDRVNRALKRIGDGTYGFCQIGKEEISAERLETIPEAENCVQHEQR